LTVDHRHTLAELSVLWELAAFWEQRAASFVSARYGTASL